MDTRDSFLYPQICMYFVNGTYFHPYILVFVVIYIYIYIYRKNEA